jgi:hypothetical protein
LAWIAFPSRSISFVFVVSLFRSRIDPAAARTSGRRRIRTSSEVETVPLPLFEKSTSDFLLTTASVLR